MTPDPKSQRSAKDAAQASLAPASGSAVPTRTQIEALIKAIADDCPFTMPFWLAALLRDECRRQGLTKVEYDDDNYRVTVTIQLPR